MLLESSKPRQLAAWLFVRWMTSAEVQARLVEDTGWLPARSSALELVPAFHQQNPQWSAATKLIPVMVAHPQAASWRTARLVLGDGFLYIFRLNLPVEDLPGVLEQMDGTVQDLQP
jgi:multiple sugar transport system substrate-binding protein/sn-glycerol 3-phosphate transport system substrate-binding protein